MQLDGGDSFLPFRLDHLNSRLVKSDVWSTDGKGKAFCNSGVVGLILVCGLGFNNHGVMVCAERFFRNIYLFVPYISFHIIFVVNF